ncbi:hypothetical protein LO762_08305 [Actinocorallia sp. API 0066]|uniref:hypothetical protein n=1 Tax=Actinocorallia sp. API 0066 TaxID=2896846 RepID=UPI001E44030E|nr:hypothetical protein [Actinocorallia sp. API 0066]MCD0449188.1 hypothetical protein [Actinocorallia sp. API 0066]
MSAFTDALMLRLHAPDGVRDLLFPQGPQRPARIQRLAATLYGLPAADIADVVTVEVVGTRFQRPLFRRRTLTGTRTRTTPDHARTDVAYEGRDTGTPPEWVDMSASLDVTLVLRPRTAKVASLTLGDLGDLGEVTTLAEFEARFRHFDLTGYMARHGLETVEDVRRSSHLLGEITLAEPPPFDPADPGNRRTVRMEIGLLVRDSLDVTGALRAARIVRDLVERDVAYPREVGELEAAAPLAPVLAFPSDAVTASGFTEADLLGFFAAQDVLAIPIPP